eukprot:GFYU01000297.1.p2 GENE.GFYU01000297.1~~GFYU01000297.1.p2  ORF type:complete len:137 (-),score=49.65 GFYU01000297.1:266-676(-)
MNTMYADFANVADFVIVYIREAHAQDEWPLGKQVCVNQPTTNEGRLEIASKFVQDTGIKIPVVMDLIDNQFCEGFDAWPEQFFVFSPQKRDGGVTVEFVGETGDKGYLAAGVYEKLRLRLTELKSQLGGGPMPYVT